ncbi:MAG: hypothetical protein R6U32_04510 [Candidatus Woesearchaeota archaeon]
MRKVNIGIEDSVHKKAKIISTLKGVTLNDYLAKAVEEAVKRDEKVLEELKKE